MPAAVNGRNALRMITRLGFLLAVVFSLGLAAAIAADKTVPSPPDKAKAKIEHPDPVAVIAAMKKAAAAMRSLSFAGGYAWRWPQDLSTAQGEDSDSASLIMIQPPGTPAVGLAMLTAFKATGDKFFLQAAREAAQALEWCQLASGGWDSHFDFDPRKSSKHHFRRDLEAGDTEIGKRHAASTLDDNKTQSVLLFLLELSHLDECKDDLPLRSALQFGLDGLLAAQAPNGGWPQHFHGPADASAPVKKGNIPAQWPRVWPATDYTPHYTLNDQNLLNVMLLLLRAHELEKDGRFLAAAKKLGDFLILAQLPEPQPGWAQQYNREMEPAWARKFEPPAVSGGETFGALRTLHELWAATGDDKYLHPIKPALAWMERSRLPDGNLARFYELGTNKPLYCKRDTYELTYDDGNLPTHYSFKTDEDIQEDITEFKKLLGMTREEIKARRALPSDPKKWASRAKGQAAKVATALKAQSKSGYWKKSDFIDAGEFVKHFKAMCIYVEAAKHGGAAFESLRQQPAK